MGTKQHPDAPTSAETCAREWLSTGIPHDEGLCTPPDDCEICTSAIKSLSALIERERLMAKIEAFALIEGKSSTHAVMIYAQEYSKATERLAALDAGVRE